MYYDYADNGLVDILGKHNGKDKARIFSVIIVYSGIGTALCSRRAYIRGHIKYVAVGEIGDSSVILRADKLVVGVIDSLVIKGND